MLDTKTHLTSDVYLNDTHVYMTSVTLFEQGTWGIWWTSSSARGQNFGHRDGLVNHTQKFKVASTYAWEQDTLAQEEIKRAKIFEELVDSLKEEVTSLSDLVRHFKEDCVKRCHKGILWAITNLWAQEI